MSHTTEELREAWAPFECAPERMVKVKFAGDSVRVAPPTADAWAALAAVMQHHYYQVRLDDTDSYNCRDIKGTGRRSLHAFGIALDVNWATNPWRDHHGERDVRFSDGSTQADRARDVKLGRADTDMTPEMIRDVLAIRTRAGHRVFEWGGNFRTVKDAMHFQIAVTPEELATGIDGDSVAGARPLLVTMLQDRS